jgi:polar amino acid transport system substrate-binding protein
MTITIESTSCVTVAGRPPPWPVALSAALHLARPSGTLGRVKQRGTLRVGVTQAPPWFSKDPKTGEWSRLGVSMGKAMAADAGREASRPVEVSWGTAIAALQGDKIDIMYMIDATPERAQAVDFPGHAAALLFAGRAGEATTCPSRPGPTSTRPGAHRGARRPSSMDKFVTEHAPRRSIQRFPGNPEAIAAFQAGRVDAVCLFHPPLLAARQRLGTGKIVVPTPAQSQPSSAALRKEDDEAFVQWVDQAMAGYYQQRPDAEVVRGVPGRLRPRSQAAPPVMKECSSRL